jgi:hypothetical protein
MVKPQSAGNICAAQGFQEIACMRATAKGLVPIRPPSILVDALKPYATTQLRTAIAAPGDGDDRPDNLHRERARPGSP